MASLFAKVSSAPSFWKAVRRATGSNHSELPSALQLENGSFVTKDIEKVEALAKSLAKNYNSAHFELPDYPMLLHVDQEFLCNIDFVYTYLSALKPNMAVGLDQIPRIFLQCLAIVISPVISEPLYAGRYFPTIWKRSRITTISKIPGTKQVTDFRRITIQPILSKLVEKWLLVLLDDHLDMHIHQFGFKRQAGTEDVIAFAQFSLDKALTTCTGAKKAAVISFDIAKAFDQCPFSLILRSLEQRAVPVPVQRLLRSYFSNRVQLVKNEQSVSSESPVLSGIRQGSLLGPKLFNVFIDGVFSLGYKSHLTVVGYADDVLLIAPLSSDSDVVNLQSDLDLIASYYQSLGLHLNVHKSKVPLVAILPLVNFDGIFFKDYGHALPIVSELPYLGICLMQSLNLDVHCQ